MLRDAKKSAAASGEVWSLVARKDRNNLSLFLVDHQADCHARPGIAADLHFSQRRSGMSICVSFTCHNSGVQRILSAFVCMYCGVWKSLLLPTECCRRFWSQHILFFRVMAVQQI